MSNNSKHLAREDVVSVYSGQILVNNTTFTVDEFISALKDAVESRVGNLKEEKKKWFVEGLDCRVLKPGTKGWQRGKVTIALEFTPEVLEVSNVYESESNVDNSPLDDIRQLMHKDNQQNNS